MFGLGIKLDQIVKFPFHIGEFFGYLAVFENEDLIFDIFGTVVSRVSLEDAFRTRAQASKAMWAELNTLDAKETTRKGLERFKAYHLQEVEDISKIIEEVHT